MGMGSPRVVHELVSQVHRNVLTRPLCGRTAHAIWSHLEALKIDQKVQCQRRVPAAAVTRHMIAYLDQVGCWQAVGSTAATLGMSG